LYTLQINNKLLSFRLYRKLISFFSYPKPFSYSPLHIIKGFCIIEALRISSRYSSLKNAVNEWQNFLYLLSLRRHNTDHVKNILYKYIKNNPNPLVRKSKKWHRENINYHIIIDFSNSINYHHLNQFAKLLDSKNKCISIKMHHSLGVSSKQLTCFFDVQKNLSFILENNKVNTYIHSNDTKPIRTELISPLLIYNMTFSEFNEFESLNQKNNYSASSSSGYLSFKSLFNFSVEIKTLLTFSSLVFSQHESEQYLDPAKVFSSLPPLSSSLNFFTGDSTYSDSDFEDFILHLVYGSPPLSSPSSSSPSSNIQSDSRTVSQEEFTTFHQLPLHVFSSSSFFYYTLH
jgi:hypothetical protein